MPPSPPSPTSPRVPVTVSIKSGLAARLDAEADARMIGKALLVEKALERFFETLSPVDGALAAGPSVEEG